jgi:hypothetical protein
MSSVRNSPPSAALAEPHVMVSADVVVADDDELLASDYGLR